MASSSHLFFCAETDCSNVVARNAQTCEDCCSCGEALNESSSINGLCAPCYDYSQDTDDKYDCYDSIRMCGCTGCGDKEARITMHAGDDAHLCAACEENMYGPPEHEDWRERTGRCSSCDYFYDLVSSADRRDLCPTCDAKIVSTLKAEIANAEAKLLTKMTKNQADDWRWLLCNRRALLSTGTY